MAGAGNRSRFAWDDRLLRASPVGAKRTGRLAAGFGRLRRGGHGSPDRSVEIGARLLTLAAAARAAGSASGRPRPRPRSCLISHLLNLTEFNGRSLSKEAVGLPAPVVARRLRGARNCGAGACAVSLDTGDTRGGCGGGPTMGLTGGRLWFAPPPLHDPTQSQIFYFRAVSRFVRGINMGRHTGLNTTEGVRIVPRWDQRTPRSPTVCAPGSPSQQATSRLPSGGQAVRHRRRLRPSFR